ncbi:hypothetical protein GCM10009122_37690 [Fulvivirga kasyanovii]|uniref:hypothetical protein n=1 Tax=Fulvivirga kasyanovii TaxID=396812 RepID=UPI0012BB9E8E|nr:hypothetical protein [Fulvivirga kasyanovii]
MKAFSLQQFLRLKFKASAITKADEPVKTTDVDEEKLSASQKRVQAYGECPLHPMK